MRSSDVFGSDFVTCPNPECREVAISAGIYASEQDARGSLQRGDPEKTWRLVPSSTAKVLPQYIPAAIRTDYEEACLIRDLSPKASATLARRCLQGMIRDFFGVSKDRLIDEINEIKNKVDATIWRAIDAVRSVGNIGAHMEKDINVIVAVDPDEAEKLIRLIELLMQEWYVQRHEREQLVTGMIDLAASKNPKTQ